MRRFLLALLALCWIIPAQAVTLLNTPITTAVTAVVTPSFQIRPGPGGQFLPTQMSLQGTFTYTSGGTTADAWVQTSFDGGVTWCDVANFHFLLANARLFMNVSSVTSIVATVTPTDGTLAANTATPGVFGTLWRVKYTTTGTYVGTTMRIDAITSGLTALP
jgi:hypothetical protein